ncbi:MAG TPA: peptide ABC transporter substrate-binding protein [Anaerolineaceae bacterium]
MSRKTPFFWLVILSLILSACQAGTQTAAPTLGVQQPTLTSQAAVLPTLTTAPTAVPKRTLVICEGQEPTSLYIYGSSTRGMWSILEAVYDGPIDTRNYSAQPVILEKLPSLAGGDAVLLPVDVKDGDMVVDATGNLAALAAGIKISPSGCTGDACGAAWDGKKTLKLDQLKVTFKLKAGIKWSDGQLLTAADSVYSFSVASAPETPVSKGVIDRTVSYKALDDLTLEWIGLPGFVPAQFGTLFWTPLPQHVLSKYKPADLLTGDDSTRHPMGWGPYVIDEWKAGDHISLHKNPEYFRASEGLPKFDVLIFRFLGDQSKNNEAALEDGECDLIDQTVILDDQLKTLVVRSNEGKISLALGQGPEWEHLDFGIRPSSYDDGFSIDKDRPDFFSDVRVRQAFAYCINRQNIVDTLFINRTSVPGGYLPPSHPLFQADLKPLPFDPAAGAKLLDEAGWKTTSSNPTNPRQASGSATAPKGTLLTVNYYANDTPLRMQAAQLIQHDLGECGVQVNIQPYNLGELFAGGPDGLLFGRKFDLTEFAWQTGSQSLCTLYQTSQIPTAKNNWLGANITGYSNSNFDDTCQKAIQTRPDQPDYAKLNQAAESLFAQELPVIPLYFRLKIAATRPDFCGLDTLDATARSGLWNIEAFDYGGGCKK